MSRWLGIAAAAFALTLGASAAPTTVLAAAPATVPAAAPAAVTGPKQPIEHLGLSGGNFTDHSGNPGCFTGSGLVGTGFAVPRGAMVTGATLYVIDSSPTTQIFGELARHNFTTGGTHTLKKAGSGGPSTGTSTIELVVDPGYVLATGEALNLFVNIGPGNCFKGAEVHFIRNPQPSAVTSRRAEPAPVPGLAPDATLRSSGLEPVGR